MTAVGEWLKQLVLVVMLATITDLLLPTKSMQQYVRMVMGMAVIALMLQPVVPLLKGDFAEQVANAALNETTPASTVLNSPGKNTLSEVIQSEQVQDVNRYADPALLSALTRQYGSRIRTVHLSGTGSASDPIQVTVHIRAGSAAETTQIRAYTASLLGIAQQQVNVSF